MKRYADDFSGGHTVELHKLPDGRFRARVSNRPELAAKEWFGKSESDATTTALNAIEQMEQDGEL